MPWATEWTSDRRRLVTDSTLGKIEPTEPFGYWIAFVPRLAGHRPIDTIAYAENGDRLGTPFTLQRP